MARTIVGLGDAIAVKRYSAQLFVDKAKESYFATRFMRKGRDAKVPIQILTELESDAGDTISFDLFAQLTQGATYGDDRLKGKEEKLQPFTDQLQIDQVRCGVNGGGRMTRKRTLHDLRDIARGLMSDWWSRWMDEAIFYYLSGARGVNDGVENLDWAGFAGNALQAPDSDHILYGAVGGTKATTVVGDVVSLALIDRNIAKAKTMGGGGQRTPRIRPIKVEGSDHFLYVMHTYDEVKLRTANSGLTWIDIQKAAAAAEGRNNPIFKGGMGMYNNVVLHSHENVVRFNDYGVGSPGVLPASRNLFMGCQAAVMAYGSPGDGMRYQWNEETDDRGNEVIITSGTICGIKKARFNGKDFGVIANDVSSPIVT